MQGRIEPTGFAAVRTPLLAFDEVERWSDGLEAPRTDAPDLLAKAVLADRAMLRRRLADVYRRPEVREALFLASPDLEAALPVWADAPDSERGRGIEAALVRYFVRMGARPTPFGLFAGCSTADVGAVTRIELAARGDYRRRTRLDIDFVQAVADGATVAESIRPHLSYRANSTLYRTSGEYRYVETRFENGARRHRLVSVSRTAALDAVLGAAGGTYGQLVEAAAASGASRDRAARYVDALIERQVLVSDLAPPVTGAGMPDFADRLRAIPAARAMAAALDDAAATLARFDAEGPGADPTVYRALADRLDRLPAGVEASRFVNVDLVKPATATVGRAVVDELARGAVVLARLMPDLVDDDLARFCEAFVDRYEGRDAPLLEALDGETGVGFGVVRDSAPLVGDLPWQRSVSAAAPWGEREQHLHRLLLRAAAGEREIALTDDDVVRLSSPTCRSLPEAFAVMATLFADGGALLHGAVGPSGAEFLGRFCPADPKLEDLVRRHLAAEEETDPEALWAEIVHVSDDGMGNVVARPVLRGYEIPFLARSGAPESQQIALSDLRIAVQGDEVLLFDAASGRRVIPRMTTAAVVDGGIPAYRFLAAVAAQGRAVRAGWTWQPLEDSPFSPRVSYGRLVFAAARWRAERAELLPAVGRRQTPDAEVYAGVRRWRTKRGLPRVVRVVDHDRRLLIDFENVMSVDVFARLARSGPGLILEEALDVERGLVVSGPEGRFVHEVVVPFVRRRSASKAPRPTRHRPTGPPVPSFPPGSEWLYAKLYAGPSALDRVLRTVAGPLVHSGGVEHWHFIRHADPHVHLRLRLRGEPAVLHGDVLPALHAVVRGVADVWRYELGAYVPEVMRYGGPEAIELCQRIFHADSEAALGIVERASPGERGLDQRWRLAVLAIDRLLDDFDFDVADKLSVVASTASRLAAGHPLTGDGERLLSTRLRRERASLDALLSGEPGDLGPGVALIEERSVRVRPLTKTLGELERDGRLTRPWREIAGVLVHMHCNRLLRSRQELYELVLCRFLVQRYRAELARQ